MKPAAASRRDCRRQSEKKKLLFAAAAALASGGEERARAATQGNALFKPLRRPLLRMNCEQRVCSCRLRGQLGRSIGQRAARAGDENNIGTLQIWRRPLPLPKKKTPPAFSTAKMARSSVFAFIGVCLAVVAAGSGSVSGKGTRSCELGIATERNNCIWLERERAAELSLSLSLLFSSLCSPRPPPLPPPPFYPIQSTAAPTRTLLDKAGGEGE